MPHPRPAMTQRVLTVITAVRATGLTNMLDQRTVAEYVRHLDRRAGRVIAHMDPGDYFAGIMFGFSVTPPPSDCVGKKLARDTDIGDLHDVRGRPRVSR